MKVIKIGTKLHEKKITCLGCNSELLYNQFDIPKDTGEWFYQPYVVCPVCHSRVTIYDK